MENNDEHNINYEYITRYMRRTLKKNEGLLREIELFAAKNDVPIAQPETMRFIEVLLKSSNVKKVLEIGAAIGYSAISMAYCGAEITTIERDENMIVNLIPNIEKAGLNDRITVYKGDALKILPTLSSQSSLEGEYDFIFIDAAKGQYSEFLPHCMRMLKKGGILFSDNVLYKGMVATDELMIRRKITITRRLRKYLDEICSSDALDTALIPIGDGAAISYKR